jgi:hypothetical protein
LCAVAQLNEITGSDVRASAAPSDPDAQARMVADILRESDRPVCFTVVGTTEHIGGAIRSDPDLFAEKCAAYFYGFTSCNKAYKLDLNKRLDRWCGSCDKCRFVFLILAPFMDKDTLIHAVGTNTLDDENQVEGYRELLGLSGHKPFECVGEVEECRWAFNQLKQNPKWQDDYVVKLLDVPTVSAPFEVSDDHLIPKELQDVMARFRS